MTTIKEVHSCGNEVVDYMFNLRYTRDLLYNDDLNIAKRKARHDINIRRLGDNLDTIERNCKIKLESAKKVLEEYRGYIRRGKGVMMSDSGLSDAQAAFESLNLEVQKPLIDCALGIKES